MKIIYTQVSDLKRRDVLVVDSRHYTVHRLDMDAALRRFYIETSTGVQLAYALNAGIDVVRP